MIDHALVISPHAALMFHLKQGFFLYVWPMLIGFLTILGYQSMGRVAATGVAKWWVVFGMASAVSMVSLFGWTMMVRGLHMIPFYGCGAGLASAVISRVYAVTMPIHPRLKMRIPRVTWRGDKEGIETLLKALRAKV